MSQFALQHGSFGTSWSLSAEDLVTIMFMRCDYDETFKCSPRHRFELFWPITKSRAKFWTNHRLVFDMAILLFSKLSHVANSTSVNYEATFLFWLATGLLAVRFLLSSLSHSFHTTAILSREGKKTWSCNARISSQTYQVVPCHHFVSCTRLERETAASRQLYAAIKPINFSDKRLYDEVKASK